MTEITSLIISRNYFLLCDMIYMRVHVYLHVRVHIHVCNRVNEIN